MKSPILYLALVLALATVAPTLTLGQTPTNPAQGQPNDPPLSAEQSAILQKLAVALTKDKEAIMANPNLTNEQKGVALQNLMKDTMAVINKILTPEQKAAAKR